MDIQTLGMTTASPTMASFRENPGRTTASSRQALPGLSDQVKTRQPLLSGHYSASALTIDYTNADGDAVSLSLSSVDYQKAVLTAAADGSDESWKKIIDDIKDEYVRMKGAIVDEVFGAGGEKTSESADPRAFDETKEIPGLPEYWSAENTATRIADFALSFAAMFEGGDDEFVGMIKDAIDKGFSQAKDLLGKMPGEVTKLTEKTHALVMDKIDKWASERAAEGNDGEQETVSV
jgi:hypothetical protein